MATKMLQIQDYTGYIKCGEVLKSPLPNNQYPFILKCECREISFSLESFVQHIQKHCNILTLQKENEIPSEEDETHDENIEKSLIKVETILMEVEDPLVVVKQEQEEVEEHILKENIKAEGHILESDEDFEDNSSDTDEDFKTDDAEETDDEKIANIFNHKTRKTHLPSNIEKFIKNKEKMRTLIELYKNQPNLWNKDLPFYRFKDKRQFTLEETTKDLNERLKLEMNWKEVNDIVAYIYRKHRLDFKRLRHYEEEKMEAKGKKVKRCWFFEDLDFLRPKPVVQLKKLDSALPNLRTDQIIKIIEIYREFPHLWNSNLIEFICSNKRHAAYNEMLKSLELQLDIKITLTTLEEYLRTLHYYFSREKCLRRKTMVTKVKNCAENYYEHLMYLYDHEGPFNCSECKRILTKPLLYKIHKASHDESVPLICSQCHKEFKTMQSYTVHAKRHFEDLEYACSQCDKKFVAYGVLRLHLLTHTGDRPFCCEICGTSYRQVQCLNRHRRRHEKRYSHICQICAKGYYSKKTYEDHMNSHMNIRQHVCALCGKSFITSKALKTHAVTHEDARNHACKLCGKTFKLKIGVLQHMRTHGTRAEMDDKHIANIFNHGNRKTHLPSNIENFMKNKEKMRTLIELYKNQPILWNKDLPFYRLKDKRQFALEETTKDLNERLKLEMNWEEVNNIITYIYQKHRIDFKRLRRYEEEKKEVKGKKVKRCWFFEDLGFLRPKPVVQLKKLDSALPDLRTDQIIKIIEIYREFPHLWNSNLIEFICSNKRHAAYNEMLKSLEQNLDIKITLTTLEEYLRTLHNYFSREKCLRRKTMVTKANNCAENYYEHLKYLYDHEGPFNCSECKRILTKPLLYKIHKASHDDSVPLICSQCHKEFKTMQSYTVHAKRHFEDLEYACSQCDKKFLAYGVLRLHLLTHTDARPYCCESCGTSFRRLQCLNRHRRIHEKRYSHICQICTKGYYTKKSYENHINSHLNIRQHVCALCGKSFITNKALKTHAVTHEDARNHACKLCGKTFKLKIGVLQHMRTHGTRAEMND